MELTKRMKSGILQGLIANIFFLIVLASIMLFVVMPRYSQVSAKKTELQDIISQMQRIEKKGISFLEFKQNISTTPANQLYVSNLLKNINGGFYTSNFTNNESVDYESFLSNVEGGITKIKSSDEHKAKDRSLSQILPVYSDGVQVGDSALTDFFFTNYIENILYTFNLKSEGDIGIGEPEIITQDTASSKVVSKNDLQEDIFVIPLSFVLSGRKSDIVGFIHFLENVGSVSVEDDNLIAHKDGFIRERLEGFGESKNIYENQISDIRMISFREYPDTSTSPSEKDFLTLLRTDQGKQRTEVEIELGFYVAGVPGYQIEKFILDVFKSFESLNSGITKDTQKFTGKAGTYTSGDQLRAINDLKSLSIVISELESDIKALKKLHQTTKKDKGAKNIRSVYAKAVEYAGNLSRIEKIYNTSLSLLESNTLDK